MKRRTRRRKHWKSYKARRTPGQDWNRDREFVSPPDGEYVVAFSKSGHLDGHPHVDLRTVTSVDELLSIVEPVIFPFVTPRYTFAPENTPDWLRVHGEFVAIEAFDRLDEPKLLPEADMCLAHARSGTPDPRTRWQEFLDDLRKGLDDQDIYAYTLGPIGDDVTDDLRSAQEFVEYIAYSAIHIQYNGQAVWWTDPVEGPKTADGVNLPRVTLWDLKHQVQGDVTFDDLDLDHANLWMMTQEMFDEQQFPPPKLGSPPTIDELEMWNLRRAKGQKEPAPHPVGGPPGLPKVLYKKPAAAREDPDADPITRAVEIFGVTNEPDEAAFILPDGRFLKRRVSHDAMAAVVMGRTRGVGRHSGTDPVSNFLKEGVIRLATAKLQLALEVHDSDFTEEQRETLKKLFKAYPNAEIVIENSGEISQFIDINIVDRFFGDEKSILRKWDMSKHQVKENPIAAEADDDAALICMGRHIIMELQDCDDIELPARWGMLHDPSGEFWPKCSLLFTRFKQGTEGDDSDEGVGYFGKKADVRRGRAHMPLPDLHDGWHEVGIVKQIFYERAGSKAPGRFKHKFNDPRGWMWLVALFKKRVAETPPVLFEYDDGKLQALRLELPDGCAVDDRGIALP